MLRDRIMDLACGAPLGSHPLTRTEPYEVYAMRRRRRWPAFALAVLLACALSVTSLAVTAWAANQPGYWLASTTNQDVPGSKVKWYWHAENGERLTSFDYEGKRYTAPNDYIEMAGVGPAEAPDGWYRVYANSFNAAQLEGNKKNPLPDPGDTGNPMHDKTILDNDPVFELSGTFLTNWAMKLCFGIFYSGSSALLSMADWFMGLIGANAESLFTQPFETGTFQKFYQVAQKASSFAVEPYALTFLAIAFTVAILRISDTRRGARGRDWATDAVAVTAVFAVCTTLILHAIDLCALIYWLAQNLVVGVSKGLSEIGMNPSEMGIGTVSAPFLSAMGKITYGEGGLVLVYALLALIALVVSAGCAISVLTMIFLRVGEIYLRAAASPLCLSFMVDEKTRPAGMGYVKRFLAVCFQAAVMFVAIALSPLFFSVADSIIGAVGVEGLGGVGGVLEALIPTIVALVCVASVVRQSEQVANSLFGLAG